MGNSAPFPCQDRQKSKRCWMFQYSGKEGICILNGWVHNPPFMKVGMTSQVFSVDALPGFRPRLIVAARKPAFPSIFIHLQLPIIHVVSPPLIGVLNSCSSPRSDEFGLSKKTLTKQDNPPRSSARLVLSRFNLYSDDTFPGEHSSIYDALLALSDEDPKHDDLLWIFIRAPPGPPPIAIL